MILVKDTTYDNFYSKERERFSLRWRVELGFPGIAEAQAYLKQIEQDPDEFSYVNFFNMIYAVGICTLQHEAVVAKRYIWTREGGSGQPLVKTEISKDTVLPFTFKNSRISSYWSDTMTETMVQFDKDFGCQAAKNTKTYGAMLANSKTLFGSAMFDTMVPVFKLNCMDAFFADPPSRWKLWKSGVVAYNPFSEQREYADGTTGFGYTQQERQPYTYEQYLSTTR